MYLWLAFHMGEFLKERGEKKRKKGGKKKRQGSAIKGGKQWSAYRCADFVAG